MVILFTASFSGHTSRRFDSENETTQELGDFQEAVLFHFENEYRSSIPVRANSMLYPGSILFWSNYCPHHRNMKQNGFKSGEYLEENCELVNYNLYANLLIRAI